MAGATAEILLPNLSLEERASWESTVAAGSTTRKGTDFWIPPSDDPSGEPLPFFWDTSDDRADGWVFEGAEGATQAIQDAYGFMPRASIIVGAMCSGRPSDQILARLCSAFLTSHQGILLFGGLLTPRLDASSWFAWNRLTPGVRAARFLEALGPFVGRIVAVPVEGQPASHAVDAEFLRFWQRHAAFHFVK